MLLMPHNSVGNVGALSRRRLRPPEFESTMEPAAQKRRLQCQRRKRVVPDTPAIDSPASKRICLPSLPTPSLALVPIGPSTDSLPTVHSQPTLVNDEVAKLLHSFVDIGALEHPNLEDVGVALLDANGRIVRHNNVLSSQLGADQNADLRGECVPATYVNELDRPLLIEAVSQLLAGKRQNVSVRLRLQANGSEKSIRTLIVPLRGQNTGCLTGFVWASSELPPQPLLICAP